MGPVAYTPAGPMLVYCAGPAEGYGAGGGYIAIERWVHRAPWGHHGAVSMGVHHHGVGYGNVPMTVKNIVLLSLLVPS